MLVAALTGSIGMGKSTTAQMFADEGVPVYDADRVVHDLYAGEAVPLVEAAFPGTTSNGYVDRTELGKRVFGNPAELKRLEAIVHPMARSKQREFIEQAERDGADLVLLDIPLLFETGQSGNADAVIVVTAPAEVQRERVLARPGMTREKFESILARQTPDSEKRARADYLIDTSLGMDHARATVREIIAGLRARHSKVD